MTQNDSTKTRGGFRQGAGRKPQSGQFREETKAIRVPLSILGPLNEYLDQLRRNKSFSSFKPLNLQDCEMFQPDASFMPFEIPFFNSHVSAGFPSPADSTIQTRLNLNEYLIPNAPSTFIVRVSGESMKDAGIMDGDLLIIDRSLKPHHDDIVVAAVNGDLTVKRWYNDKGKVLLKAENPEFQDILLHEETHLHIWGVVTHVIHQTKIKGRR